MCWMATTAAPSDEKVNVCWNIPNTNIDFARFFGFHHTVTSFFYQCFWCGGCWSVKELVQKQRKQVDELLFNIQTKNLKNDFCQFSKLKAKTCRPQILCRFRELQSQTVCRKFEVWPKWTKPTYWYPSSAQKFNPEIRNCKTHQNMISPYVQTRKTNLRAGSLASILKKTKQVCLKCRKTKSALTLVGCMR